MKRVIVVILVLVTSHSQQISFVASQSQEIPITGIPVPGMESYDRIITNLMAEYKIPGGAVAVAKDGRLVFAHGYGYADMDTKQTVQPDSLFRIASISKPITATAILKLVEEGTLSLDDKAFKILDDLEPPKGEKVDSRIYDVTIRQLLQHSGGWDRDKGFDPMFIPEKAAKVVGTPAPASCETVIRYMLGEPLDFTPGKEYVYSNFGYCVLGRVIEKKTGQRYEDYVKTHILTPMGITEMRIGHTLLKERESNEVHYYDYPGAPLVQSVFPGGGVVPNPYGGFYLEAMDAHGGWIASAIDLVRFTVSLEGRRPPAFLESQTISLMLARPESLWIGSSYWYGMGWNVRPITENEANWWHTGSLAGTTTILVRACNGLTWAALFNIRLKENSDEKFRGELDQSLWKATEEVTKWPTHDLFGTVTPPTPTTTPLPAISTPVPIPTTSSTPTALPTTSSAPAATSTTSPTSKQTGISALYMPMLWFFLKKYKKNG